MKKNIFIPIVCIVLLASCSTKKITHTTASLTKKDEVVINNNSDFPIISIVGEGGRIIEDEKRRTKERKEIERENKLRGIKGLSINTKEKDGNKEYIATLGNDILFAHDRFDLSTDAKNALLSLSEAIKDVDDIKITVIGYTDSTGEKEYNLQLSQLRANSVSIYLHSLGIGNIDQMGKGVENPVDTNSTAEGRRKNRRVEIIFTV